MSPSVKSVDDALSMILRTS